MPKLSLVCMIWQGIKGKLEQHISPDSTSSGRRWEGTSNICEYVKCCQRCILAKTPEPAARAPLESIRTSAPMELVCIDFWSAEDSNQRSVDVLVITDHFTK